MYNLAIGTVIVKTKSLFKLIRQLVSNRLWIGTLKFQYLYLQYK